jgi:hypothetical protein
MIDVTDFEQAGLLFLKKTQIWTFKGYKEEKSGKLKQFWEDKVKNLVPTEGLNSMQYYTWLMQVTSGITPFSQNAYIGLIDNASFGALAATDTAAKITTSAPSGGTNNWKENIGYSQSTRQLFVPLPNPPTTGYVDNSASVANFTVSTGFTLNGGFIVGQAINTAGTVVVAGNTKGGTGGVLLGEVSATSIQSFTTGQIISIQFSSQQS